MGGLIHLRLSQVTGYLSHNEAHHLSNWTLSICTPPPPFLQKKSESMQLWLHVNYRQFFQGLGGEGGGGGGSVSMHSTHMNERNLATKLYPIIFPLFPWETREEGWSQVTAASKKNQKKKHPTQTVYTESSGTDLITG